MPRSSHASTIGWILLVPRRWPARRGRWRRWAQRPLPSIMMATCRGTATPGACAGIWLALSISDRHDLLLLMLPHRLKLRNDPVGDLLEPFLRPLDFVGRGRLLLLQGAQLVVDVAAAVTDRHFVLFDHLVDLPGQLFAPLLGQWRDRQADDLAVVGRVEAQIGFLNSLLDRADGRAIVGLNDEQPRIGHADLRQPLKRGLGSIILHQDVVEDTGAGPAGPDGIQISLEVVHRAVHAPLALRQ